MGLTFQELQELLEYVEQHHSWKNSYSRACNGIKGKLIKYVAFNLDTRECDIWSIKFYNVSGGKEQEKSFRTEQGYNLKEEIYKWLKQR